MIATSVRLRRQVGVSKVFQSLPLALSTTAGLLLVFGLSIAVLGWITTLSVFTGTSLGWLAG